MSDWLVEIVSHAEGEVVKRMGPMTMQKAERVERGAEINLDHERYYVRTVRAPEPTDEQ